MRGMEELLTDLMLHPDFVQALLDKLTDYLLQTAEIILKNFRFEAVAISDDYPTQHGLLISPHQWRRFIKPRLARIYKLIRKEGRFVMHHSDGDIREIIPDLIEIGCDVLHPVQPECMDIFFLKKRYGQRLTFFGGVSTQDTLVKASPGQVVEEVRRLKKVMGCGGGYILSNGITLQADVPDENLLALIETALKNW
ncbi:MAG TPA: uroporphyrinogen decarboxylase family protein [bacterium]|nr:uroporphyrinogen decarboxylase family protein [bacterium]